MSVRVVARIRPLLKAECEKDVIVDTASTSEQPSTDADLVRIPNPKNPAEHFSFHFNSVYDAQANQETIFQREVAPTLKQLFQGLDVTLFAYGVTGTGKTHTMRGGKSLADRGLIPRLLSAIYRRGRKVNKDSEGETTVDVAMSYYEIYNDRVFDLFEAPEKRTMTGLPLREQNGKTVVVGLTERPCTSLKDFEHLYDQANINRSTSATKLNAYSSRSHAILRVKVTVTTGDETRISTASAIDLAGSEDNRRTENGKERLVESASINKSLFVLAQCVEAISKKQSRIPYRESKMTRILSLGQNQGVTVMILNLAPVKSFHLDTLSSLNFANRTKRIEVKEIENEPIFRGPPPPRSLASLNGSSIQRQPLRPLTNVSNTIVSEPTDKNPKPSKAFAVYSDLIKATSKITPRVDGTSRGSDHTRTTKILRPGDSSSLSGKTTTVSKARIEEMVERKVEEILAARALNEPTKPLVDDMSEQVQQRLAMLEQRIEKKEDSRSEGLTYLLMAKQHHVRGEELSALQMYKLALPYFPNNDKLRNKMLNLEKMRSKRLADHESTRTDPTSIFSQTCRKTTGRKRESDEYTDDVYSNDHDDYVDDEDGGFHYRPRARKMQKRTVRIFQDEGSHVLSTSMDPATSQLLQIINTRDLAQIKLLKGVGIRKAEAIVECLETLAGERIDRHDSPLITDLEQLGRLRGVGAKTVENMRLGLVQV